MSHVLSLFSGSFESFSKKCNIVSSSGKPKMSLITSSPSQLSEVFWGLLSRASRGSQLFPRACWLTQMSRLTCCSASVTFSRQIFASVQYRWFEFQLHWFEEPSSQLASLSFFQFEICWSFQIWDPSLNLSCCQNFLFHQLAPRPPLRHFGASADQSVFAWVAWFDAEYTMDLLCSPHLAQIFVHWKDKSQRTPQFSMLLRMRGRPLRGPQTVWGLLKRDPWVQNCDVPLLGIWVGEPSSRVRTFQSRAPSTGAAEWLLMMMMMMI